MRYLLAVLLMLAGTSLYAQQTDDYLELMRADMKTNKRAIMTEAMQFTEEQSANFWPMYRDYEYIISKVGDKRIAIIKDFAKHYEVMSEEKAGELFDGAMANQAEELELRTEFGKKLQEEFGSVLAVRFMQVEQQINMIISLQISQQMPLIKASSIKAETAE